MTREQHLEILARANRIRAFLEDDLIQAVLKALEQKSVNEWRNSASIDGVDAREMAYRDLRAMDRFLNLLRKMVNDGKVSQAILQQQQNSEGNLERRDSES